ncbi:phosphate acyltransferase [Paraburkholderia aromaticivorans]|uniref:phosphate acyltransferase n=1 Tax=Paraburkholderia aromaticivorans TaxID=2026199 RepID=UPI0012FD4905
MLSLTVIGELRQEEIPGAGVLLKGGEGDGMICGMAGTTNRHLLLIDQVIGKKKGCNVYARFRAGITYRSPGEGSTRNCGRSPRCSMIAIEIGKIR